MLDRDVRRTLNLILLFGAGIFVFSSLCSAEDLEVPVYIIKIQTYTGKVIEISGNKPEIWKRAQQFIGQGDYPSAVSCYEQLIQQEPRDVRSHILLGQLHHYQLGKYADAIWYYKRAESMVPPNNPGGVAFCQRLAAEAYRTLAEKTNSFIYFVQAIGEYEKVLMFQPDDTEVLYYLASCRLNSKDFDRAAQLFKTVIDIDPDSEWAVMSRKAVKVARSESKKQAAFARKIRY